MSNTLMMLSTSSHYPMEEVMAASDGPKWFQLYHRGYEVTEMLVHRAEEAGFKAIVLTVDTPVPSPKERDVRNHYENPYPLGNFRANAEHLEAMSGTAEAPNWRPAPTAPLTWKELEWLRGLTSLPLVLKGVRTAEDTHIAVENGVNGILVSTHGGRQIDQTMGAIEMLPEIVQASKGLAEVYLDSGVRRGSDVLKALALGARAVGVGRPLYWGLAVNGAEGVHGMLEVLRRELDHDLASCGQTNVQEVEPGLINIPNGWVRARPLPERIEKFWFCICFPPGLTLGNPGGDWILSSNLYEAQTNQSIRRYYLHALLLSPESISAATFKAALQSKSEADLARAWKM